jgi:hypothetical protein
MAPGRPRHRTILNEQQCPYCGGTEWSLALGSGGLKVSGIILAEYNERGDVSSDPGIEVAAFTCQGCGYIRFHDPAFLHDEGT